MKKLFATFVLALVVFGAFSSAYAATPAELDQALVKAQSNSMRIKEVRLPSKEDVNYFVGIAKNAGYQNFMVRTIRIAGTNQSIYALRFW